MRSANYLPALEAALLAEHIPGFDAGASGYFSAPQPHLDPEIFEGDVVRPEVSTHILRTLFRFWKARGYRNPEEWTTVWLAGSGISYQWAGDRGNGDLDVLMGIDWPAFYRANDTWAHTSIEETTDYIDNELRQRLWPRTANTIFGGKTFELTYYVNQDATDILNINPYAAYNLTDNTWTVRPPEHTAYDEDPGTEQWRFTADADLLLANILRAQIETSLRLLPDTQNAEWVNRMTTISGAVDGAYQLMTEIHGRRREAFKPGGKGYYDFNNWRWQMAKKNGIVAVLGAVEKARTAAIELSEMELYGVALSGADKIAARVAFMLGRSQ